MRKKNFLYEYMHMSRTVCMYQKKKTLCMYTCICPKLQYAIILQISAFCHMPSTRYVDTACQVNIRHYKHNIKQRIKVITNSE